jgi:MFS family permease
VPITVVLANHPKTVIAGLLISLIAFVLFYLNTVFALSWGTTALKYTRQEFLQMQLFAILFFAATIPLSAVLAERGRRVTMIASTVAAALFGLVMARFFEAGTAGVVIAMSIGMGLTGLVYGPLGTMLSELFPTAVRYSGSSLTFNLAGIFGASLAPYFATALARNYGLQYVGYYLTFAATLSLIGLLMTRETKDQVL